VTLSRRRFLRSSAAVGLGFAGLHGFLGCRREGRAADALPPAEEIPLGFGPLRPDPQGLLDLPGGFTVRVLSRKGDRMSDGLRVPAMPDAMGAFAAPGGRVVLVRNHEVDHDAPAADGAFGEGGGLPAGVDPAALFDAGKAGSPALGGTTTIVLDAGGRVERQFLSLGGTVRNCAGGPTPWGTWISCEESVARAGARLARDHGWAFEVSADPDAGLRPARRLPAMGRFYREAVAIDPATGIVYQSEDLGDGLLYRFVPDRPGDLAGPGRLQAMTVADRPGLATQNWEERAVAVGDRLRCAWIDLDDPDNAGDDLRRRGHAAGAAQLARAEGMWFGGDRGIFVACTNGGPAHRGQIWRYAPDAPGSGDPASSGGTLELFLEADDTTLLENGDNLTVSPWGDLIVCEDGEEDQYLVGVTPEGRAYRFGRNAVGTSELAGAVFSPDGATLFVNIQNEGLTLAVTGPWERHAAAATGRAGSPSAS
jgi:secreted PhoX family phosphatase